MVQQDKECKASAGTNAQRGRSVTLRQSFAKQTKPLSQAIIWPIPKISRVFLSFWLLYSYFLLYVRNKCYLILMQRGNKISITWTVNLHSWITSPLLFSLKIEIRKKKGGKNNLWNLAGTAGNHTLSHRAFLASVPTVSFSHSCMQHSYTSFICRSLRLALAILFFLYSASCPKYCIYPVSRQLFIWFWRYHSTHSFCKMVSIRPKQQLRLHLGFTSEVV